MGLSPIVDMFDRPPAPPFRVQWALIAAGISI
ncbi:UNVERIFIED_CONTAM: hypothetical protein DES50_1012 [Williamsia faeni]|jgi:hypothetical protein